MFSGALVIALLVIAISVFQRRQPSVYVVVLVILISEMSHAETWWVRFAPQLWIIPVVCYFCAIMLKTRLGRLLGMALALTLVLNVGLVASRHLASVMKQNQNLHVQLSRLSTETGKITAQIGRFQSYKVRLAEQHVGFVEADVAECKQPARLMSWPDGVVLCIDSSPNSAEGVYGWRWRGPRSAEHASSNGIPRSSNGGARAGGERMGSARSTWEHLKQ